MNRQKYTQETAIEKCKEIHKDLYDYSKTIFTGTSNNIEIICKTHGSFKIGFNNHVYSKRGCPKCTKQASEYTRNTLETFIKRAKLKHGDKFDYSLVKYKNQITKVKIICPLHGVFEQLPLNHYRYDCKQCSKTSCIEKLKNNENSFSKSGFKGQAKDKICTLYVIKCWNEKEKFYKIGITTQDVKRRFHSTRHMPYNYEIIKEQFGEAESIWTIENNLKKKLKSNYVPEIKFPGSIRECYSDLTEIFNYLD